MCYQTVVHMARTADTATTYKVKMKVISTSSQTCKVVVESSSRSVLNLLNFGANKANISDLSDYINNEVYKLTQPEEIKITKPTITFR